MEFFFFLYLNFFLFTFFILILFKLITKYYYCQPHQPAPNNSKLLRLPPGPWQLPIIGSIHHFLLAPRQTLQLPHRYFCDLSKAYGPLIHLKLGEISVIVASSPEAAREIMKTHDVTFATRPLFTALKILTYGGQTMSLAPYGEYWRQLRRMYIVELLSPKRIHSFRLIREEEVHNLIQSISNSSSDAVNLSEKLGALTNNIMARAAIGTNCKDQRAFLAAVKELFEISGGFDLADLFPSWSWLLGLMSGHKLKIDMCHQKADRILDAIIQQRKHEKSNSTSESKEVTAGFSCNINGRQVEEDLLDVLLRVQEDGSLDFPLTTNRIKAVLLDILGAGAESSLTSLEWAMSELIKNPEVMRRAQSEVREFLRGKCKVTEEDIKELNYLRLVIKETLRLHPPGPLLLPRECQETCEILGYKIPEKARVVINAWAMGRDSQYWEDAEKFTPERFEGNPIDFKGANFEFLPFGSGRRMCPGMMFGLANVELALAQLLYYFNWELPHGIDPHNLDMSESFGVTARRTTDLCLRCHPHVPFPAAVA